MRPFRVRRPPIRLDAPGDHWPLFPLPAPSRTGRAAEFLLRLFRRRRPRGVPR